VLKKHVGMVNALPGNRCQETDTMALPLNIIIIVCCIILPSFMLYVVCFLLLTGQFRLYFAPVA